MVAHVRTLEKKLTEWPRLRPADEPDGNRLQEILRLTEEVSAAFQQSLERCATPDMLALQFNQYHHQVDRLIDRQAWPAQIRQALDRLLGELLDGRTALIDPDRPLPRHEREHVQALVDRQLPVICTAIERHQLPAVYGREIRHALRNLFDEKALPLLTYRHKAYLPLLIGQGLKLAAKRTSTRWKHHLLELLVNCNFNYMGIFERWRELREAEIAAAAKQGGQEACLQQWQQTAAHYNPKPGIAFDPDNASLHVHMQIYLRDCRKRLEQQQRLLNAHKPWMRLLTKLLIGDLAVRFRYFFLAGDFDYPTQQEAAAAFCEVYEGKGGKRLTAHGLTKFDKEALYTPARRFYGLLGRMRKTLEEDFGFKPTDSG
ncbi:hypothetical protein [Parapedobacter sp. 2B3]|uniref:hypothetical protein n=1 Tax=Parapedobacter sp. 2B3 TaxID=3342381 RepID=UPI0035B61D74